VNSTICSQPETVDIVDLIECVLEDSKKEFERLPINYETVQQFLKSMDTEYHRGVAKVLLCANRSRNEIVALGINSDQTASMVKHIKLMVQALENVNLAASDIVHLHLHDQEA
jgi:hypothetical protein